MNSLPVRLTLDLFCGLLPSTHNAVFLFFFNRDVEKKNTNLRELALYPRLTLSSVPPEAVRRVKPPGLHVHPSMLPQRDGRVGLCLSGLMANRVWPQSVSEGPTSFVDKLHNDIVCRAIPKCTLAFFF